MDSAHRPGAVRSAGTLSARILLALASLAAAFTLTVVGAEPAGATTIERSPDQIVIRSNRMTEDQTHVTGIITLHRTGHWTFRIEAHCTARLRKYVNVTATVHSPSNGHSWWMYSERRTRVGPGAHRNWEETGWSALLEGQWDEVLEDPYLTADFHLDVFRTS